MKYTLLIAAAAVFWLAACDKPETKKPPVAPAAAVAPTAPVAPTAAEPGSAGSNLPIQLQVVGRYNIVKFKGAFYACPHGLAVNWDKDDAAKLPGVLVADSQDRVIAMIPR